MSSGRLPLSVKSRTKTITCCLPSSALGERTEPLMYAGCESTLATPSMARRSLTSDSGILADWPEATSWFISADEEIALERLVHPGVDVVDVVEDVGSQADGRADGDVQDADGQRRADAAAEDLPMGDPAFGAQQRIQHRGHEPRQRAEHHRHQQQEGHGEDHAGDDHHLDGQVAEDAGGHHRAGDDEHRDAPRGRRPTETRLWPSEAMNRMPSSGETRPAIQAGMNIASSETLGPRMRGDR